MSDQYDWDKEDRAMLQQLMNQPRFKVKYTRVVSDEAIMDTLTNWFDSGIANFYVKHTDHKPYREVGRDAKTNEAIWALRLPIVVTLETDCDVKGKRRYVLDDNAINKGLTVMAQKYPKAFAVEFPTNRDNYNGDAATADLFVQCCLFGEETFS